VLQDRSGPNRLKPMAATATAMVKAIWASYFQLGSNAEADEAAKEAEAVDDAAAAAKAVEEVQMLACQPQCSASTVLPHKDARSFDNLVMQPCK
jgi:hypothetical protein